MKELFKEVLDIRWVLPAEDLERVMEHEPKLGELNFSLEKFFLHFICE
jgi:hypothetical protein